MNALGDLTTEVRFRERMRGYDYNEVDEYVKAVAQAAAQAMERMAELEERLRRLEGGDPRKDDTSETREAIVRTLVLAQRTADTAVAEARAEAQAMTDAAQERATKTVAEAEAEAAARLQSADEKAAQVLAEGEENCQLIIAETKRTAAIEIAAERERWLEELRGLQEVKADLEAASARIRVRLEDEQAQLHRLVASLQVFVDEIAPHPADRQSDQQSTSSPAPAAPADFTQEPEASAASDPVSELVVSGSEPVAGPEAGVAGPDAELVVSASDGSESDGPESEGPEPVSAAAGPAVDDCEHSDAPGATSPAAEAEPSGPSSDSGLTETSVNGLHLPAVGHRGDSGETASEEAELHEGFLDDLAAASQDAADDPAAEPVPETPMVRWLDNGDPEARPDAAFVAAATQSWPVVGDESPGLFDADADAGEDEEFIEQLRRVVSSDAPLPDSEAAMSAFFDHDDGAVHGGGRGRSGSLRKLAEPPADGFGTGALRAVSGPEHLSWP